jgi:DNA-binding NarL/FixJ family response regulator
VSFVSLSNTEGSRGSEKAEASLPLVRVLVVEDFVPFRHLICSKLEEKPGFQVVCQVSDGLDAVQKAEELKPELILLDVGLPSMNGIAVAREIRKRAPDSKIIFVSQESSADVVQEAFRSGARGYVAKLRVGTDLLPAVEAVLEGRQFISSNLQIILDAL